MTRRRSLLVLVGALLALVAAALPLAAAQDVQLEAQVFDIARKLRCPVCVSESVADSNAQLAQQMRALIQQQLEEGRTDDEIYAYFQARYGDWIMLEPPKRGIHLLVWLMPVLVALTALAVVAVLARRWLATARAPVQAADADVARVRAELAGQGGTDETPARGDT